MDVPSDRKLLGLDITQEKHFWEIFPVSETKAVKKLIEGVRELIPHTGPIPILIPLKLFFVTKFKFQNVISF